MYVIDELEGLQGLTGEVLGTSDWLPIDQARVNAFADSTGDHQWIHVDLDRAAAGPFGGTIAHGYLTLALIPFFSSQVFSIEAPGARLNYGLNKVRFPAPLKVGLRVRDRVTFIHVNDASTGKQLTFGHTIEIDGQQKPACVAEAVVLLVQAAPAAADPKH